MKGVMTNQYPSSTEFDKREFRIRNRVRVASTIPRFLRLSLTVGIAFMSFAVRVAWLVKSGTDWAMRGDSALRCNITPLDLVQRPLRP